MTATDPIDGLDDLMDIILVQKADTIAAEVHGDASDAQGVPLIEKARQAAVVESCGWRRAVALLNHVTVIGTGWTELDLMAAGLPREVVGAVVGNEPERT